MSPDIERLIAGYATNTLSPREQEALFEAALEDQAVFDAILREQPLRELLDDPAARRHVLASLERKPGLWQRLAGGLWSPAGWAVAGGVATLVVGVVVGTQVWMKHAPAGHVEIAKLEKRLDQPAAAAPARVLPAAPATARVPAPAPAPAPAQPREKDTEQAEAPRAPSELEAKKTEEAAPPQSAEPRKEIAQAAPPPPLVPSPAPAPPPPPLARLAAPPPASMARDRREVERATLEKGAPGAPVGAFDLYHQGFSSSLAAGGGAARGDTAEIIAAPAYAPQSARPKQAGPMQRQSQTQMQAQAESQNAAAPVAASAAVAARAPAVPIALGLRYTLVANGRDVEPGASFGAGDEIRVKLQSNRDGAILVLVRDGDGWRELWRSHTILGGRDYLVPASGSLHAGDTLLVVVSRTSNLEARTRLSDAETARSFPLSLDALKEARLGSEYAVTPASGSGASLVVRIPLPLVAR